jgi:hypothetical protein
MSVKMIVQGRRDERIEKYKLSERIYLLRFKNQYQLTSTFLRIQEHYESPRFHGQVFTLEEYIDWYVKRYGAFTYYKDWAGFNVPSKALKAFYDGQFAPSTKKEQRLLQLFKELRNPFYIIGIYKKGDLKHEIAHALYFVDSEYKKAVRKAVRPFNTSVLKRQLAKAGYARHVIADEVQAHLISPAGKLGRSHALRLLRRQLRALFREHSAAVSLPLIK